MEKRNLSGMFFITKMNGERETRCFEELPKAEREKILDSYLLNPDNGVTYVYNLINNLCDTINEIGNQFDLVKGYQEEEYHSDIDNNTNNYEH